LQGNNVGAGAIEQWKANSLGAKIFDNDFIELFCLGVVPISNLVALVDLGHSLEYCWVNTGIVIASESAPDLSRAHL
jgi:hypothetical protein